MAKGKTKSTAEVVSDEVMTSAVSNESVKEENVEKQESSKKVVPLEDSDEIVVKSLISNVSYKDSTTGDMYSWKKVDDEEVMSFAVIKNLWRGYKTYFKELWLKPMDERVIDKLGLKGTYAKYETVMNKDSYSKNNLAKVCAAIKEMPSSMKLTVYNKIKTLIANGDISDVYVIITLEYQHGLDLLSFLE